MIQRQPGTTHATEARDTSNAIRVASDTAGPAQDSDNYGVRTAEERGTKTELTTTKLRNEKVVLKHRETSVRELRCTRVQRERESS